MSFGSDIHHVPGRDCRAGAVIFMSTAALIGGIDRQLSLVDLSMIGFLPPSQTYLLHGLLSDDGSCIPWNIWSVQDNELEAVPCHHGWH